MFTALVIFERKIDFDIITINPQKVSYTYYSITRALEFPVPEIQEI